MLNSIIHWIFSSLVCCKTHFETLWWPSEANTLVLGRKGGTRVAAQTIHFCLSLCFCSFTKLEMASPVRRKNLFGKQRSWTPSWTAVCEVLQERLQADRKYDGPPLPASCFWSLWQNWIRFCFCDSVSFLFVIWDICSQYIYNRYFKT